MISSLQIIRHRLCMLSIFLFYSIAGEGSKTRRHSSLQRGTDGKEFRLRPQLMLPSDRGMTLKARHFQPCQHTCLNKHVMKLENIFVYRFFAQFGNACKLLSRSMKRRRRKMCQNTQITDKPQRVHSRVMIIVY